MQYQKFANKFMVRIDRGEELVDSLTKLCQDNNIHLGTIQGIGAANQMTIGLFNTQNKEYRNQEFTGDFEIAQLHGNIATFNKQIYLHLHINFGDDKHHSFSGHLNKTIISGTFEGVIEVIEGEIKREFNGEVGLNLWKF